MAVSRWRPRATLGLELVFSVAPGLLVGTLVFGAVLYATDRIEAVAQVYSLEGVVASWLVVVTYSLTLGVLYAAMLLFVGRADDGLLAALNIDFHDPIAGAIWGGLFSFVVWLGVVELAPPVATAVIDGGSWSLPSVDWIVLLGAVLFGLLLGGGYPLVRDVVS
ncbi:hypothetical protein ACFOZ7_19565 [Natribaculum luteum]|uniref:ABC transporter permease n=1 Tax=Natribaculum luteum TaxID=1586232 RepID=A0ABD5P4C1_9EURY|nr:hypothetical protein [Natribaculum luteum]